ncbi:MAG: WavE lipopolysaccharide synthesis family protein [Pirellulaceae bacterium]
MLCWLIRTFSWGDDRRRKRFNKLQLALQKEFDVWSDNWLTKNIRFKNPPAPIDASHPATPIAIVMQGKLVAEESFTLKTIQHYGRTFPGSLLLVSTWKDEDPAILSKLEAAGARIVLSEPPPFPGPTNVNYQIRSTLAGIEAARAAGHEYVLKTRADTRMYASDISDFLISLHRQFPASRGTGQKGRLLVLDYATRKFLPHHPSDILMFGRTEDLHEYWNTPLCDNPREAKRPACRNFGELFHSPIPEVYLCRQYLDRLGYAYEPTIENWWRCLADIFLVVDRMSLEHFWFKYDYTSEHRSEPDDHRRNLAVFTFRDWLALSTLGKQPTIDLERLMPQRPNDLLRQVA